MSAPGSGADRGMDVFRDPLNVVVVGASDDPTSWGYWLAVGALAGADRRGVHLVNRHGRTVQGRTTVAGIPELPEDPDLVVLAVPGPAVGPVVDAALARGARGFLGITADISGTGDPKERNRAERELAERIRAAGARLIGPNCLGLFDAGTALELAWGRFPAGGLGLVSQSGQVGLEIGGLAARAGIGFSRFVSIGSQADVTLPEALADLAADPGTRVAAVYAEDLGDARELVAAAAQLRERGIPVLLLQPGTSVSGARAAASHTAALAGSEQVTAAVARAAGMTRVLTPAALVGAAAVLLAPTRPRLTDQGIAVVSDSGGQGVIAADLLEAVGIALPVLAEETQSRLHEFVPRHAGAANPVDLAGSGERDLVNYARAVERAAADPGVGAVLLSGYFGSYCVDSPDLAAPEAVVADAVLATAAGTSVVVHSMAPDSATAGRLRAGGVPVFATVESAVAALAGARTRAPEPPGPPATAAAGPADRGSGYAAARRALESAGVPFPAAEIVAAGAADPTVAAATAANRLALVAGSGVPRFAVKATGFQHKTEVGGVVLGVELGAVGGTAADLVTRLGPTELTVELMAEVPAGAVELIVGGRVDRNAGPLLLVGAGGVLAELMTDSTAALAPVRREQARAALERLRIAQLLHGWRGAPPVDVDGLVDVLLAVSGALVGASGQGWEELEINPLLCWPGGVLALDAWGA